MMAALVDILAPHDGFGVRVCSGVPCLRQAGFRAPGFGGATTKSNSKAKMAPVKGAATKKDDGAEARRYEGFRNSAKKSGGLEGPPEEMLSRRLAQD
jgi:hypothetical protein